MWRPGQGLDEEAAEHTHTVQNILFRPIQSLEDNINEHPFNDLVSRCKLKNHLQSDFVLYIQTG